MLQILNELATGARKRISVEIGTHNPCEIIASKRTRAALDIVTLERVQGNTKVRKSVFDRAIPIIDFDIDTRGFSDPAPASVL